MRINGYSPFSVNSWMRGKPVWQEAFNTFAPGRGFSGHIRISDRILMTHPEARHSSLGFWITTFMEHLIEKDSHLVNLGVKNDITIDDEHCVIPRELFSLEKLRKSPLDWEKIINAPQGNGHLVYFRRDEDDGIFPEECYIVPAMAIGLIGKMTQVVREQKEVVVGKKTVDFFVDKNFGHLTYRLAQGENHPQLKIPYELTSAAEFIKRFKRGTETTILNIGHDFPRDGVLLEIVRALKPEIVTMSLYNIQYPEKEMYKKLFGLLVNEP